MRNKLILALQMFADDPAPGAEPGANTPSDPGPGTEPEGNTEPPALKYTDEDVDRIIDKKFAEWERKQQKKSDEAARLAQMNTEQKEAHEKEELKKRVAELERQNVLSDMSKVARGMLAEKNISVSDELVSMMISDNADDTKSAVESFIKAFQEAVNKAVKDALKGEPPKTGAQPTGVTKEDIMKIPDRAERQRQINAHMDLFV